MNNNPYRAYWEKAREQSLKLAQYYTPECLVDLCLALLQPKGELFDPCCGLGSFLLKAKEKDETLRIGGNDIATDLGELPFEFNQGDYLASEDKEHDYTIANIPFNIKKSHCNLVYENYCWIEKIIANTRKKTLIVLPSMVNARANPKIYQKRKDIVESGVLELVAQLPSHLFNKTGIAPCLWLINKEKVSKDIYFLNAEKFSEWKNKQRFLTEENISQICDRDNWKLETYEKIKEYDYCLIVGIYDSVFKDEPKLTKEELNHKILNLVKELKQHIEHLNNDLLPLLNNLEKDPDFLNNKANE